MKLVKCNLCGQNKTGLKYKITGYKIVECQNCGLVYLNPQPSDKEIEKEYENQKIVFSGGEESILKDYLSNKDKYWQKYYKKRLLEIKKFFGQKRGKILDIGCAGGFFLDYLKKQGWETFGVEISDWGASVSKKKLNLNVVKGTLREALYPSNFFDVVTMYDVLEHTQDPTAELKEVQRILKKKGLLVVNVPNIDSFISKLNKEKWNKLIPGQHLYFFTPKTIKKILSKNNFDVLNVKTNVGDKSETGLQILGAPVGLASPSDSSKTVKFYRKYKKYLAWIKNLIRFFIKALSLIFVPIINWILVKTDKAEGITVYAQKQ